MLNVLGRLPVGVMMPVLNARSELPRHLASMREWLEVVSEVVVVDSYSEDGTVDYLREHLHHPQVTIIEHPRGLYQSWNRGVAELRSKYFFVSTLGDTTSAASIHRMFETAEALQTDVLVGVPTLVDDHGKANGKRWPLHEMVSDLGLKEGSRIGGWLWMAWALMYLPATPIGSSASNLYRTGFMQKRPFPLDFGRIGDSAWAVKHAFDARFGIEPRAESTFWVHGVPVGIQQQYSEVMRPFIELVEQVLAEQVLAEQVRGGSPPSPVIAEICQDFQRRIGELLRYFQAAAEYRELKRVRSLGAKLKGLRLRLERGKIRRGTLQFREKARAKLRG
jgi:hypothetical protein